MEGAPGADADDTTDIDGTTDCTTDGSGSPDVRLGSDAFDAFIEAVESLDSGKRLEHGTIAASLTDAGYAFEADGERHVGLSESGFHEHASDHAEAVTDWHFWRTVGEDGTARAAFYRWLEGFDSGATRPVGARYADLAEGITREWGQVAVTVTLTSRGRRTYDVRHVDEVGVETDALTRYEDPADVHRLVKFDDGGRYRPLKTAPTLPTGWLFTELDHRGVYETVEAIYPATVANWYREREGELDVSHWHETMERQSGIYGLIETWDRGDGHEHVEWVAEACCDDSQCLKRREWEYDGNSELDADGGDGIFPCREPCSLVVSAARKWTKLESEESRTYEFELTPSEKAQIEDIVGAVADGRVDDIREADLSEGANRYRARFLRAKRFDENGALNGVPSAPNAGNETDGPTGNGTDEGNSDEGNSEGANSDGANSNGANSDGANSETDGS